ncbi:MAG: flavodoxin [Desulfobacterales bacterium]|nr:flavodoxin [Desulfobacterales bacterium]
MDALVIYDSLSGNTEKVAQRIYETSAKSVPSQIVKVNKDTDIDLLDHDLVFIGSGVIDWLPTKTLTAFVQRTMKTANKQGRIKPAAPIIPGKFAVCFATFGGPHIGVGEAVPMTLWLRSALAHLGFIVLDEWHVPGQFANRPELNQGGRLGNIEGRPDAHDLQDTENRVRGILASLSAWWE